MSKRKIRYPICFLKVILTLLISLLLFEFSLRLYQKINPSFIFPDVSYNRFRPKPFSEDWNFYLNSKGFKDKEYSLKKPKDVFRILGIGDSFVYGVVPYKNNFLTLLEDNLNTYSPNEVINMGIPGFGMPEYYALFKNEGLPYQPDMLCLFFYSGNDFIAEPNNHGPFYAFSFLKFLYNITFKYQGPIIHVRSSYNDTQSAFSNKAYLEIVHSSLLSYQKDNPKTSDHINFVISYFKAIQKLCDKNDIKLFVVLIPSEVQVDTTLQRKVFRKFDSLREQNYDFKMIHLLLGAELTKLDIPYYDLLEVFQQQAIQLSLYRVRDSHWNVAGNKLAADVLTVVIKNYLKKNSRHYNLDES